MPEWTDDGARAWCGVRGDRFVGYLVDEGLEADYVAKELALVTGFGGHAASFIDLFRIQDCG